MRLAVLADIHAILPALEMALEKIEHHRVDGLIVAGDMLAGPNPVAVMNRLRRMKCWMIRGNQENYMMRFFRGEAPDWWYTAQQWSFTRWNFEQLNQDTLEYIATLPEQRCIDLPGSDPIRVVHGSPRNVSELIYPDQNLGALDQALEDVPEPVVLFGHSHRSWQMKRHGKLAVNPGALSGNFRGKPGGGYAILDWQDGQWQARLYDLNYDVDAIRKAFSESGLLEAGGAISAYWLRSIESGVNFLPGFVDFAIDLARRSGYAESAFVPDHIWAQADSLYGTKP